MARTTDFSSSDQAVEAPSFWARLKRVFRPTLGREPTLKESFEDILSEHHEIADALTPEERLMITNIVSIRESRIYDVMVPRAAIVSLDLNSSLADSVRVFRDAAHSRLPVYRETTDDIIGMVHIKDLIEWWDHALHGNEAREEFTLKSIMRKVLFVPPSMPVLDLMLKMQAARIHMAIVIDEFGATDGLVTIEDLVEEIVGEILDEHEDEGPAFTVADNGVIDADARVEITELENHFGFDLVDEDEDIDTIGGLVVHLINRVPQRGELVRHPEGLEIEISDADARRIRRVRITPPKMDETGVNETPA